MASTTKGAFRAGRVLSPDSKWTGEEPEWKDWQSWPIEKFMKERMRMLGFYTYYLSEMDLRPDLVTWMKNTGKYSKSDMAAIKTAPPADVMLFSASKLARAINRGMPTLHPLADAHFAAKILLEDTPFEADDGVPLREAKDDTDIIRHDVAQALASIARKTAASNDPTETSKPRKVTTNPHMLAKRKTERTIIAPLEFMLDDQWGTKTLVAPMPNFLSLVRDSNTPAAGCAQVKAWLENQKAVYEAVLTKSDPELVEGYSYLGGRALKSRIKALDSMLDDVAKCSNIKKALRKPRVKKTKDASKQIARLKFQPDSVEYSLTSINPIRVPGAYQLYTFNTKYRTLSFYQASGPAGFEIKGSGLKGFDQDASFTTTLRKPAIVLGETLALTPAKLEKSIVALKTKRRPANGRFNEQVIILRVIEKRPL
jgi:hypothetical protein